MESVGLLAGGVAHDFNNLLTVILGCTDVLGRRLGTADAEHQALLSEITSAAQRAADLTRQLLAFSRRQVLQPRVLDLNNVVADVSRMLGRMLGEDVKIERLMGAEVGAGVRRSGAASSDHRQPRGQRARRDAQRRHADARDQRRAAPPRPPAWSTPTPGAYVVLIVRDTGLGMDEVTRARIFEPFFTTKGEMGTGLGLATVYGIVKQSGGQILVSSEPGRGRRSRCSCRGRSRGRPPPLPRASARASLAGRETVLLVEDESLVRAVLKKVLVGAGYGVLEAANAEDASLVHDRFDGTIHALVTDVVMPGKTGLELARHLTTVRPALKVLYMSGYAPNAPTSRSASTTASSFLQKPITPPQLLSMLRDVLDRPR